MPWINRNIHYLFQVFINQVTTFHESCGKIKHQSIYQGIADAASKAIDLLFQEEMPEGADVKLSSISCAIQAQLGTMADKKVGKENTKEFIRQYAATSIALAKFTQAYNQYLKDQFLQPAILHEEDNMVMALTSLEEPDVLLRKIKSLRYLPHRAINNHCSFLFKRAFTHQPKTMAASALTGGASVSIAMLSLLDHTVGVVIDKYLNIETRLDYKDVLALVLFLVAIVTLCTALTKSYQQPFFQENDEEMGLFIDKEKVTEQDKLLRYR